MAATLLDLQRVGDDPVDGLDVRLLLCAWPQRHVREREGRGRSLGLRNPLPFIRNEHQVQQGQPHDSAQEEGANAPLCALARGQL